MSKTTHATKNPADTTKPDADAPSQKKPRKFVLTLVAQGEEMRVINEPKQDGTRHVYAVHFKLKEDGTRDQKSAKRGALTVCETTPLAVEACNKLRERLIQLKWRERVKGTGKKYDSFGIDDLPAPASASSKK